MSWFWVKRELIIPTPLPETVQAADVVELLQQREAHLRRSPPVLEVEKLEGKEEETFLVTEKVGVLPANSYTVSFSDRPDGMDAWGWVGSHTKVDMHWTVAEGVMTESVTFEGWIGLVDFIIPLYRNVHIGLHQKIVEDALKMNQTN